MRDDITSAITYLTDTVGADPERIGLLGHSMGSFYARQYLCEWGDKLDGAIIMGTGWQPEIPLEQTIAETLEYWKQHI